MKSVQVMILSTISLLLLLLPLLVVESSSLNHTTTSSISNTTKGNSSLSASLNHTSFLSVSDTSSSINGSIDSSLSPSPNVNSPITNIIKRGSSISTFSNPDRWISPSGKMAFGFFTFSCPDSSIDCQEQYGIGIYFEKYPSAILVWTTNRYYDKPSSVLFTNKGKLVVRSKPDGNEEPLIPTIQKPVSYAMMLDTGNFVLYGAGSEIVWQSFDNPTDTILGGQSLRSGVDLVSGGSRLSVQEMNGAVTIHTETSKSVISDAVDGLMRKPVILSLNTAGELYLVDSDGVVLKYLYRNKNQEEDSTGIHMYRATLHSTGQFSLYKERIDGDVKEYFVLLKSWSVDHMSFLEKCIIAVVAFAYFVGLIVCCICCSFWCALLFVAFAAVWLLLGLLHIFF